MFVPVEESYPFVKSTEETLPYESLHPSLGIWLRAHDGWTECVFRRLLMQSIPREGRWGRIRTLRRREDFRPHRDRVVIRSVAILGATGESAMQSLLCIANAEQPWSSDLESRIEAIEKDSDEFFAKEFPSSTTSPACRSLKNWGRVRVLYEHQVLVLSGEITHAVPTHNDPRTVLVQSVFPIDSTCGVRD